MVRRENRLRTAPSAMKDRLFQGSLEVWGALALVLSALCLRSQWPWHTIWIFAETCPLAFFPHANRASRRRNPAIRLRP